MTCKAVISVVGFRGVPGTAAAKGDPGLSAYEVALANGYVGTEAQWVASLRGEPGADGPPGATGAPGDSPVVEVASTSTLDAGVAATVSNISSDPLLVRLAFGIPKGIPGDSGGGGTRTLTIGRVVSGWIHVKSNVVASGVNTWLLEVGANTQVELLGGSPLTGTGMTYRTEYVTVPAGEATIIGGASAPAANAAALALSISSSGVVTWAYLTSTISTTDRLCMIAYAATNAAATTWRSALPSNHFFSQGGSQPNPDITQTTFDVRAYGASVFDDATDNSAALLYAKWAAQVVNKARKGLALQYADPTRPDIKIVFPPGTFLADFSLTKYPSNAGTAYAQAYWGYYEGIILSGAGLDVTVLKHTGGSTTAVIYYAESLTFHRIRPLLSPHGIARFEEVRYTDVRWYFEAGDTLRGSTNLVYVYFADGVYFKDCVLDYQGGTYTGILCTNYDTLVIEGCVINPSKLGYASHQVRVEAPLSKLSRYRASRNKIYQGKTGLFIRLLNVNKPMVGTVIEGNYLEGITEESIAIDGIGDSSAPPVIAQGLLTAVDQPAICPGEYQWLRYRTFTPGSVSAWSTPVCLSDNTTSTAYAFKSSATQPATPTDTGLIPVGWSSTVMFSDDPVWMSQAPVTDGIAGTWSAPVNITEVRCFQTAVTSSAPVTKLAIQSGWALTPPALPHTNVWMCKAESANGMVCGPNNSWSSPVNIDATPEEATWIEYCVGTTFSSVNPPIEDGAAYRVWRNSPWKHNLVIQADFTRVADAPVSVSRSMEDFFFALEDGSGREGTVCDILYADPVTQSLTLQLDIPAASITIGGRCAVHSGLFDARIHDNEVVNGYAAISLWMNVFGCVVERNKVVNSYALLALAGMLSGKLRCKAHNNIIRDNLHMGMREEDYIHYDTDDRASVAIYNPYANSADHCCFNNKFIGNTLIGGRVRIEFQGNFTWADNTLIDVIEVVRKFCTTPLPTPSSVYAGQVFTRISGDEVNYPGDGGVSAANFIPGRVYKIMGLGVGTDWNAVTDGFYTAPGPTGVPVAVPAYGVYFTCTAAGTGTGVAQQQLLGLVDTITYHVCKYVNGVYTWVDL